jgi:predicted aspartyl protease
MGSVVVDVVIRGPGGEVRLRALVDTGFYGDIITVPDKVQGLGVEFRYERVRRLPNGEVVKVRYGVGEVEVMGEVSGGDIEVWPDLKLPIGIDALLGVTALEKLGFRVDSKTGRLEKVELYLL